MHVYVRGFSLWGLQLFLISPLLLWILWPMAACISHPYLHLMSSPCCWKLLNYPRCIAYLHMSYLKHTRCLYLTLPFLLHSFLCIQVSWEKSFHSMSPLSFSRALTLKSHFCDFINRPLDLKWSCPSPSHPTSSLLQNLTFQSVFLDIISFFGGFHDALLSVFFNCSIHPNLFSLFSSLYMLKDMTITCKWRTL